jgi:predicted nuclease of predicted toxin-antitoxin system
VRFLVDESTGHSVVQLLRSLGHDVVAAREVMPRAEDTAIFARAAQDGRVLVTNDKDFGELVIRRGQPHAGVLLLRLRDERPSVRAQVVRTVVQRWPEELAGAFTVATEQQVRIRHVRR